MASRVRHLRARVLKALFKLHTRVYEATDGRLGAHLKLPMLLLTVTGRKTRQPRTTPLAYFEDAGGYVVVGSDGGARRDPQWWLNLRVDPSATVRVGRRVFQAKARLAEGTERARLWERGKQVNPAWSQYQKHTQRELPVVVLEPIG
ncbi:MAG: nitroreductase family deazaflavin-dependent oxidoreductase [Myxococcales bacterium]